VLSDRDAHSESHDAKRDESIKETFESIVIAFILAFVFRAYVVEAFVIPTGSMAPTLMGQHFRVMCEQCGYRFECDGPESRFSNKAVCPMCHHPNMLQGVRSSAGDRILVHKYIYSLSEPRRWDVIVFKAPHDPKTNYIKRLVGLPNESLAIIEGNIYVKSLLGEAASQPWTIARKTGTPGERVQRTVWQPVYHTAFEPLDGGDENQSPMRVSYPWRQPWVPQRADDWTVHPRRGFTFKGGAAGEGTLRFDFRRMREGGPGLYVYNQLKGLGVVHDEPIEDIRLAAFVEPAAAGASVTLSTTARVDAAHGPVPLHARLDGRGRVELVTLDPRTGEDRVLASDDSPAHVLHPGRTRRIELWYVDQQASLWLDGRRVVVWQYDLPNSEDLMSSPIMTRPGPALRPELAITVAGAPTAIHHIELDRDLYYGSMQTDGATPGTGGIVKGLTRGSNGEPVVLAADEFFTLGDNSPQSSDGRFWDHVDPWVLQRMFYPDHPAPQGIVPRKLLIGRAFFVYFPGPFYIQKLPLPNFGQMRFIH
jgi:signal peptidase I